MSVTGGNAAADVTSYVGRRDQASAVRRLLGTARLITLTGPGGVGKTRLARRVAQEAARAFRDGVRFVGLAELRDAPLVPNAVADALGLQQRSTRAVARLIVDYLRDRQVLLLLDNCEHLLDASAELAHAVLTECPRTVILATSRQSLGLAGEHLLPVPPLPAPDEETTRPAELPGYPSVELFLDRVSATCPSFRLTEHNAADVAKLCRDLDGVPLAIELAAARVRSLTPRQINERLADGLGLLASGQRRPQRHRTLRSTIDWSYRLCSPQEQAVWARASVFAGTFDLDAAEQVCAGPDIEPGAVLDLLEGLLDKSVLIREDVGDHARYRMLETLRAYGCERLAELGEDTAARRRHRDWFDRLTATADAEWVSPHQLVWTRRLHHEHANLRAALDWSVTEPGEAGVALRMTARLDEYWGLRGSGPELQTWLTRALAAAPPDHPARARALTTLALFSVWQTEFDTAEALLNEAEGVLDRDADPLAAPFVTSVRALSAVVQVQPSSRDLAAAAAEEFRALGEVRRELHPLFLHAVAAAFMGDLATGRAVLRRMAKLTEECGETYYRNMSQFGVAVIESQFGDVDAAAAAAAAALRGDLKIGSGLPAAYNIDALAWVATRRGEYRRAASLFGAAAAVWDSHGVAPDIAVSVPHNHNLAIAKGALGEAEFDAAFQIGRALSPDEAWHYALGQPLPREPAEPAAPMTLTRRELEVAELVAEGLSNRAIAAKLVISVRTATTHVQHILTKLGFANRAQIATWVAHRRSELATPGRPHRHT
ncbi:ATP-binding protein [Actinokineospora iranica]|uniref:ATP-binding protein n=1 Tax=Actinokineospora iranica TaxID=1271860 RepID=UPI000B874CFF|nr:LuxR C-terminal-related transcriptional regulator [Actinokineospora iranica]